MSTTQIQSLTECKTSPIVPSDVAPKLVQDDYWRIFSIKSMGLIILHLSAIVGAFLVPLTWSSVILCYFSTVIRGFGISAGYHRYFSHKSFSTSRPVQFILAVLGATAMQSGPIWWASHHRYHHRYADTDVDTHSPKKRGFMFSHFYWTLVADVDEPRNSLVPDLLRYKELVLLEKVISLPGITYAVLLWWLGGFTAFFWGFVFSTTIIFQVAFCINSITHIYGSIRFPTQDESRNNYLLGIIALGEGYHNNHHAYDRSAKVGFEWWEVDAVYYVLCIMEKIGLIWNVKRPNKQKVGEYVK